MARSDVPSDAELIQLYRAGDANAFNTIVLRHSAAIQRLVKRYTRNESDAQDVTQQVFLRALEQLGTFRGESSFSTWLYRVAVTVALNHLRRTPPPALVAVDDLVAFTHSLQTSNLVAAEVWRKVSAHIEVLPPKQRLIVELRVFHDLSFDEIAVLAESTESAARMNYSHAVKRLRAVLPGLE
jgi:RNA polymerase sigma-70 factor (ECF subfamily)